MKPDASRVRKLPLRKNKWVQDKKGYFLIEADQAEKIIRVGFCREKNRISYIIEGKTSKQVTDSIVAHGLVSSLGHAAYLGRELRKAEFALKLKKKYVQDDEVL